MRQACPRGRALGPPALPRAAERGSQTRAFNPQRDARNAVQELFLIFDKIDYIFQVIPYSKRRNIGISNSSSVEVCKRGFKTAGMRSRSWCAAQLGSGARPPQTQSLCGCYGPRRDEAETAARVHVTRGDVAPDAAGVDPALRL